MTPMNATGGLVDVRAEGQANQQDVKSMLEVMNKAFEEFKSELKSEMDQLKKSGSADVVTTDKIKNIENKISEVEDQLEKHEQQKAASELIDTPAQANGNPEYKADYESYIRTGSCEEKIKAQHRGQEVYASMSVGTDADGGFTAPVEWDRKIEDELRNISPMRDICRVVPIGKLGYSTLYNKGGTASGWVGETDPRSQTNTSTFEQAVYNTQEIYAMPGATSQLLNDSEIDIADWMAQEVKIEFAKQEGDALLNGDGVKKPIGLMQYGDASGHPLGDVVTVNSGAAATITGDGIIDLVYELPEEYEDNARFIMNKKTLAVARKLKDGDGNYLWQPSQQAGEPALLNGFPIKRIKGMPNVAADAVPIAFGDFNTAYWILDRKGIRVLRDPFTAKPYVLFYTTKRVGGFMRRPDAIVYHKCAVNA